VKGNQQKGGGKEDPGIVAECTVELDDPGGAKMQLHINGAGLPDLVVRTNWGPEG